MDFAAISDEIRSFDMELGILMYHAPTPMYSFIRAFDHLLKSPPFPHPMSSTLPDELLLPLWSEPENS